MRRRLAREQLADKPRRIPDFPRPPDEPNVATIVRHRHRLSSPQPHQARYDREGDEDIMSNPSEEAHLQQDDEYLAVAAGNLYTSQSPNPPPRPKHSREPSAGQYSVHDPAQAHSRTSSDTFGVHFQQQRQQGQNQTVSPTPALNPFAKPFVFGVARQNQLAIQQQQLAAPPNAPRLSHSPLPSVGDKRASISSMNGVNNNL